MTSIFDQLRDLKNQAKNRRDLRRYERAAHFAGQAIELARGALEAATVMNFKVQLASELADSYGLLGGIQRRWGLESIESEVCRAHLQASVQAYDQGYEIESDKRYGLVNSYNLLNRLLGRVLLNPRILSSPSTADAPSDANSIELNLRAELGQAAEHIEQQLVAERRGDYWAMADVALINLLLGREDPQTAYARFNAELPPEFAYKSVLETLRGLAQVWVGDASTLREAITQLERRIASNEPATN